MLLSCCHYSMIACDSGAMTFGSEVPAVRLHDSKCFPKAPLANSCERGFETERLPCGDVPIVLSKPGSDETRSGNSVLHRCSRGQISTIRDGFVANLVLDGESLVAERDIGIVQTALDTHSVVVVRNAELTIGEQIALTKLLGEPQIATDMRNHHPDSTEVMVVSNEGRTPVIGNQEWHSDRSFLPSPTRYTILHGLVVPGANGVGDTLVADMIRAYAEAPVDWKHVMEGAKGVHTYDKTARLRARLHNAEIEEYMSKLPPVRHPLVRGCHAPRPNTPALFLSDLCLARLEYDDGTVVPGLTADMLLQHATQSRFVYRHRWAQGDLVIWDNQRVLHKAAHLPPGVPRTMHRTTTADAVPVAVTPHLHHVSIKSAAATSFV